MEHSVIRQWLNTDYYNSFLADDRVRIAETRITNADNPWYGTPGGNDTTDRIFLLSLEEVVQYFGDSGQLGNRPDDKWWIDDQYNSARIARDANGTASWWWLRSPGDYSSFAAIVYDDGFLYLTGSLVDHSSCGVRPALWLNLES